MIKFSIPKGFLRVCERKEAYEISFFLQDRADGRGQRTRRQAGAILGWLMLGQVWEEELVSWTKWKGKPQQSYGGAGGWGWLFWYRNFNEKLVTKLQTVSAQQGRKPAMLLLAREDVGISYSSVQFLSFLLHADLWGGVENEVTAQESGKPLNSTVKKH